MYQSSSDRPPGGAALSSVSLSYSSRSDGLLANLQEKLVASSSSPSRPFSAPGANSNTDLRTLADLATMGEKSSSSIAHSNGEAANARGSASEALSGASSHDHIAKALDRC